MNAFAYRSADGSSALESDGSTPLSSHLFHVCNRIQTPIALNPLDIHNLHSFSSAKLENVAYLWKKLYFNNLRRPILPCFAVKLNAHTRATVELRNLPVTIKMLLGPCSSVRSVSKIPRSAFRAPRSFYA
jgi:hypothetical protein